MNDICANFHRNNAESVAANPSKESKSRTHQRIAGYLGYFTVTGKTCDEIEQALAITHQSCSARISELKRDGLIEPAGKRPTRSGRMATAYRLTQTT